MWLDVATALTVALRDEKFSNLGLSFKRSHSLAKEIMAGSGRLPTEYLGRWGLEESVVRKEVEVLRELRFGKR